MGTIVHNGQEHEFGLTVAHCQKLKRREDTDIIGNPPRVLIGLADPDVLLAIVYVLTGIEAAEIAETLTGERYQHLRKIIETEILDFFRPDPSVSEFLADFLETYHRERKAERRKALADLRKAIQDTETTKQNVATRPGGTTYGNSQASPDSNLTTAPSTKSTQQPEESSNSNGSTRPPSEHKSSTQTRIARKT